MRVSGAIPSNIDVLEGNFLEMPLPERQFSAVICSDVFEHVPIEQEAAFAQRCADLLAPGGSLIVSTPHRGTFAWLDPYEVKPALHRVLAKFGMYSATHNGFCDIRKGHKHYSASELVSAFAPLEPVEVIRWGYLFDPLSSWTDALGRKLGPLPWRGWIDRRLTEEYSTEHGDDAFNIAINFRKPEN
jgi:SAM-dependent methyltransferase